MDAAVTDFDEQRARAEAGIADVLAAYEFAERHYVAASDAMSTGATVIVASSTTSTR